jgi:hypothetical protein
MNVIRSQPDDDPTIWHFAVQGLASDQTERIAYFSVTCTSPEDYLTENESAVQAGLDASEPTGRTWDDYISDALAELNRWRGSARRALGLTDAWGQELVYSGKFTQAVRWNLDGPLHLLVPFYFAGEASARGLTNQAMADLIIDQGEAWLAASDAIEAGYIAAKGLVEAAESEGDIVDALASLEWPG